MQTVFRFALEQSILNAFGMLLGIAAAVLLFGSLLHKKRAGPFARTAVYALGGVGGGIWSYISFDKEPTTQYVAIPLLIIVFFIVCLLVTAPFTFWRNKNHDAQRDAGGGT